MKKPRVVLFDLGNVLVRYTPESFWEVLGIAEKDQQERYKKDVTAVAVQFESGRITTQKFFDELGTIFGGKFDDERLKQATASVLTDPIPRMEEIVQRVSQRAVTALVSNTNEFHYAYCQRAIPALKLLPKHFLSFQMGVMKPDRAFYDHVTNELRIEPSEALFIDDVRENVEGAERCGMKGIVFRQSDTLLFELRELGLL